MNIFLLINIILSFTIIILFLLNYFRNYKYFNTRPLINAFSVIIFSYFILLFFSVIWFFSIVSYSEKDFVFIFSVSLFIQTISIINLASIIPKGKYAFYWVFLYVFSFLSLFFYINYFSLFFISVSFLIHIIISLQFFKAEKQYHRLGYFIFLYGLISIISLLLFFIEKISFLLLSNILALIFLFISAFFFLDVNRYVVQPKKTKNRKDNNFLVFIRYFIFILVLLNFVMIATIGIHELSHVIVARYYGCESRSILFDNKYYVYSEIVCSNFESKVFISLAAPIIPSIIGILLYFFGGFIIRPISLMMIGFNLLASYKDFLEAGFSENISLISSVIGAMLLVFGVILLEKNSLRE